jgi:phosphoribosylaminoimidazolecarboxamide formyltransferase/IMP cyclohydrolase
MPRPRRALLAVSDKTGAPAFARGLAALGFEILSTGNTARVLREAGVTVREVAEVTGFPEILGGRVKTLHPAVHGGILARRDIPDDLEVLARYGIVPIDVVAVNLYPFAVTTARPECTLAEAIEEIDIGGPTLLRAAAKNWRHVTVVCEPADYAAVLEALASGGPEEAQRYELAVKAFVHTARYDGVIAAWLSARTSDGSAERFPRHLAIYAERVSVLRYGENPHQAAALYRLPGEGPSLATALVLQGKEISFNNLLDLDAALALAQELDPPAAVVVKHTNPCGVALGATLEEAYRRARECDPRSAFGGIVALTGEVDGGAARALAETFLEAVVAPGFSSEAREILGAKKNLRLVVAPIAGAARGQDLRRVWGGLLAQEPDRPAAEDGPWKVVTRRAPTDEELAALRFAWRVVKHVKSNAVVFARAGRTAGIGAGQMSRVDAVEVARRKAGASLAGTVLASDAFFPFPDGLIAAAEAGATAVVQPGGSVRDEEVIAAADERGVAMVFTGARHFRH